MKKIKKLIATILAVCTSIACMACFTACGGGGGVKIDTTKTQVYVGNNNYGFGSAWLDALAKRFEEKYAEYEFEPGTDKKGVQVVIDNGTGYGGQNLYTTVAGLGQDVIFGESTYYYQFINGNKMLDITDLVTEPLTEFGESRSIAQKLSNGFAGYLKTADDKYYGVPNYECTYWITYNVDYFDEEGLYFDVGGNFCGPDGDLSAGPDGETGNYDDGLPATLEQFFELCQEITDIGDIPITWPGGEQSYRHEFLSYLLAGFEGKNNYNINYNFNGTVTDLIKEFDGNGNPVLETKEITPATAYEQYRQSGRYYALRFFEELFENSSGYVHADAIGGTSNFETQYNYINSSLQGKQTAMLFEGNYWTNEATNAFNSTGLSKDTVNYGVMPFPRATDTDVGGRKNSYAVGGDSLAFIYSGIPANRKLVAEKFLQFAYTDESLKEYTKIVGTSRGCDVSFSSTEISALTPYAQNSLKYRNESDLLIEASSSNIYINNIEAFTHKNQWGSYVNDHNYSDPIEFLRFAETGVFKSVDKSKMYFEKMLGVYKGRWDNYSQYFN